MASSTYGFDDVFGFYLMGWFIFTFLMLMCTLRSTLAFFLLFFFLDLAFLLLGISYLVRPGGKPSIPIMRAGGAFAILSAFAAWYNALAGILDRSNSFFLVPGTSAFIRHCRAPLIVVQSFTSPGPRRAARHAASPSLPTRRPPSPARRRKRLAFGRSRQCINTWI